ncbi:endolytic transglycosylase MltG [Schleiferilactobacillus shenzhenensis]|uniref:endolytic transglycosylase MltG n=1 Tax=Schleiferilactobacillus shenzhenensis TaxID=1231337 RepID=UPI00058B4635|nr:endolytic transglycosylase MltG [Schleiferilactobacillus shenzhenensis]
MASKIVVWIVSILAVLAVVIGILGYRYVHESLQPYNTADERTVAVKIPIGSSNKEIAAQLEKHKIIRSATVFNYYVKTHNYADFTAGWHSFKPSMSLDQVVAQLQKEGLAAEPKDRIGRILVKEGVTVEDIANSLPSQTKKNKKWDKASFLKLMKDDDFVKAVGKKYPELLKSALAAKNTRYPLEGYLAPATYDIYKDTSLKDFVVMMVHKSQQELAPLYKQIAAKNLTVQQTLTLASLVEREGVKTEDRQKIAGVFFNRLDADMPLQSDISVMYALNEHKTHLTNKDTSVDSPYNLYINKGYGPGPFNNPSLNAVHAVLSPKDRDQGYLYFQADLKTGKIYYSQTYEQHTSTTQDLGQ